MHASCQYNYETIKVFEPPAVRDCKWTCGIHRLSSVIIGYHRLSSVIIGYNKINCFNWNFRIVNNAR